MPVDKLYEPEVLARIGELKATDTPWVGVQIKLKEEFGIETSVEPIKRAYNRFICKSSEIIASDEKIKMMLTKPVLDAAEQLSKINKITFEMLEGFDNTDINKLAVIKEIRNQIEMQERVLNKINQSLDPTSISKIEYTKISVNNLAELEKQGLITINRNRLSENNIINVNPNE